MTVRGVRCHGTTIHGPRRGQQCARPALTGERYCIAHHPACAAENAAHLAAGRARKAART